ncbi:CobW family GTP-binding protein [Roseomonas sp. BN140053]|uniref:CobW family GTP-binding protein n=1 Tax=Roseomonas sp. BN140053 TaxID=3391898 RepID=UPI0039E9F7A1
MLPPFGHGDQPFGRRQRRPRGARVPVTVVTGFLGAGKTTLIRHFLDQPEGAGTAVVVNEFGEVGIDQALLAPSAERVVLLGNGCLCCTARSGLDTTFRDLLAARHRGDVPPFQRVVLETSGADDPAPILGSFLSDRALAREYHLQAVVAAVDLATGAASLAGAPEARRQVAVADRIVLTKGDLAPPGGEASLRAVLRGLNPRAPVTLAGNGVAPPALLLEESPLAPAGFLVADDAAPHGGELASFTLVLEHPLPWTALTAALGLLCELRGADLLRVKGIVAVRECRGPVVVHAVQHILHRPLELEAWPDADRRSRLVFITRGLQRQPVLDLFRAVAGLAAPDTIQETP